MSVRPLSLRYVLVMIAVIALTFAFLPAIAAVAWTVTLTGILVMQGLRLPVITEKGGLWRWVPWVVWLLVLGVCPFTILILGVVYEKQALGSFSPDLVFWLVSAHVCVSIVAAISVVILARGVYRWVAWAAIMLGIALTVVIAIVGWVGFIVAVMDVFVVGFVLFGRRR